MSTIFLSVGQCGNQLGESFWQEAAGWYGTPSRPRAPVPTTTHGSSNTKYSSTTKKTTTHGINSPLPVPTPYSLLDGTIPSILVDTEPKVIRNCTSEGSILGKQIPLEFRVVDKQGRGSNWAFGYSTATKGASQSVRQGMGDFRVGICKEKGLADTIGERIQTLIEKCDRFGGFVLLHSMAGGTGSGVGSAIIKQLREDYPLSYILSIAVAPFAYGESPLQHYNSLLCLHTLQKHADGILLFQNDNILTQVEKFNSAKLATASSRGSLAAGNVSIEDMNRHVSQTLCNALLPIWNSKQKSPPLSGSEPWELIRSLCPDPALKFILLTHSHLTSPMHTWDTAFSSITASQKSVESLNVQRSTEPSVGPAALTKPHTSALVVVCRAAPAAVETLLSGISTVERKLKQVYNTVQWNPFPVDVWPSFEPKLRDSKMVSVLANSALVGGYLDSVVDKAQLMYQERAYLHWYRKYGCERETFEEAFEVVREVANSYRHL